MPGSTHERRDHVFQYLVRPLGHLGFRGRFRRFTRRRPALPAALLEEGEVVVGTQREIRIVSRFDGFRLGRGFCGYGRGRLCGRFGWGDLGLLSLLQALVTLQEFVQGRVVAVGAVHGLAALLHLNGAEGLAAFGTGTRGLVLPVKITLQLLVRSIRIHSSLRVYTNALRLSRQHAGIHRIFIGLLGPAA